MGLELIIRALPTEPTRRSGFFFYSYTEVKEEFLVAVLGRWCGWGYCLNMCLSIVLLAGLFCLVQVGIHHGTSPAFWSGAMSLYISEILQHQSPANSCSIIPWAVYRNSISSSTRGRRVSSLDHLPAPMVNKTAVWPCPYLILLQLNSIKNWLAPMKTGWEEGEFMTHLSSHDGL